MKTILTIIIITILTLTIINCVKKSTPQTAKVDSTIVKVDSVTTDTTKK